MQVLTAAIENVENVSAEQPTVDSSSAVPDTVSHAAKIFHLQNDNPVSATAILSSHLSEATHSPTDSRVPSIHVINSASATASPSQSSLTSPDLNHLRLSLAKATRLSTGPGDVKFESPKAGGIQQDINMALVPEPDHIIAGRDASPAASSAGELGTVGDLFNSLFSELIEPATSGAASSAQTGLTTSVSQAASDSPTPTTTNALSVLFSALPSSIADPLQSEFNSVISAVTPADQSSTNTADSSQTSPTHTANKTPHTSSTGRTTRTGRPTRTGQMTHSPTTHDPTTKHTTSPTSHTTLHTTTATQTDPMSQAHPTNGTAPPPIGSHPISNASIAGIVSGLGAGFIVAGLAGIYIFRRKKAGKPIIGGLARGGSKRSTGSGPYPAVAWLYDPKISPPGTPGHSRNGSVADGAEERLIPEPRPGSVEMASSGAPHLPPARPSSPLLAPHMPPARERSPSPGRNRASSSASMDNSPFLRPISED